MFTNAGKTVIITAKQVWKTGVLLRQNRLMQAVDNVKFNTGRRKDGCN